MYNNLIHSYLLYFQISLIPMRNGTHNASAANCTTGPKEVCKHCSGYYKSLQQAYKEVIDGIPSNIRENRENSVCGDVSAAVSMLRSPKEIILAV